MSRPCVLPSTTSTVSAPGKIQLSRLDSWPMHSPTDASPTPRGYPRGYPRGRLRTARGRCGSLLLHRSGLSPPTPCRFHRRTEVLSQRSYGARRRRSWHHRCSLNRWRCPVVRVNDLSRSVVSFEQSTTCKELAGSGDRARRRASTVEKAGARCTGSPRRHVADSNGDHVTAAQLAVDRQVEQGSPACAARSAASS